MTFPILVDVDGVLIDWLTPFTAEMCRCGLPPVIEASQQVTYDLHTLWPDVPKGQMAARALFFQQHHHYRHLEPLPGALAAMFNLRSAMPNNLLIAVSSCGTDSLVIENRRHQLRYFPFESLITLPFGESKARVFGQFKPGVVIEDAPSQIEAAQRVGHGVVVYDQPYNQHVVAMHRVKDWREGSFWNG